MTTGRVMFQITVGFNELSFTREGSSEGFLEKRAACSSELLTTGHQNPVRRINNRHTMQMADKWTGELQRLMIIVHLLLSDSQWKGRLPALVPHLRPNPPVFIADYRGRFKRSEELMNSPATSREVAGRNSFLDCLCVHSVSRMPLADIPQ